MDSIYVLIPVTTFLLGLAIAAYLWSVGSGQFEDLDKASRSILFDDTDAVPPPTPASAAPPPGADAEPPAAAPGGDEATR